MVRGCEDGQSAQSPRDKGIWQALTAFPSGPKCQHWAKDDAKSKLAATRAHARICAGFRSSRPDWLQNRYSGHSCAASHL
jgi:hypothetical protein